MRTRPTRECSGSSPRLRGTRPVPSMRTVHARFIPAPAGNTSTATSPRLALAVHPRACGEHARLAARRLAIDRFIPAPAGNTAWQSLVVARTGSSPRLRGTPATSGCDASADAVHPRACGEHPVSGQTRAGHSGSSPRLRGTLAGGYEHVRRSGSSPRLRGTRSERLQHRWH